MSIAIPQSEIYDMDSATEAKYSEQHSWRDKRFTIAVTGPNTQLAQKCRALEAEVFGEEFENDLDQLKNEYGPYEESSRFFCVIDKKSQEIAGVLRVFQGEVPQDFKAVRDIEELDQDEVNDEFISEFHEGFDSKKTWEVGTLVVPKKYRGRKFRNWTRPSSLVGVKVSAMLYHNLFVESEKGGIDHWIMMIDEKAKNKLRGLGIPIVPFCGLEPRPYLGSEVTYPGYVDVRQASESVKNKSRLIHGVLAKGLGITALSDKRVF